MSGRERRVQAMVDAEMDRYGRLPVDATTLERLAAIYEGGNRILRARPPSRLDRLKWRLGL